MTDLDLSSLDDLLTLASGHIRRARLVDIARRSHHINSAVENLEAARAILARWQLDLNHAPHATEPDVRGAGGSL